MKKINLLLSIFIFLTCISVANSQILVNNEYENNDNLILGFIDYILNFINNYSEIEPIVNSNINNPILLAEWETADFGWGNNTHFWNGTFNNTYGCNNELRLGEVYETFEDDPSTPQGFTQYGTVSNINYVSSTENVYGTYKRVLNAWTSYVVNITELDETMDFSWEMNFNVTSQSLFVIGYVGLIGSGMNPLVDTFPFTGLQYYATGIYPAPRVSSFTVKEDDGTQTVGAEGDYTLTFNKEYNLKFTWDADGSSAGDYPLVTALLYDVSDGSLDKTWTINYDRTPTITIDQLGTKDTAHASTKSGSVNMYSDNYILNTIGLEEVPINADWISPNVSINDTVYMANISIETTNLSSDGYIDKIEVLNSSGTIIYLNDTNIITDNVTYFTYENMTNEVFSVKVFLVSNGTETPIIHQIYGYYNELPEEQVNTSLFGAELNNNQNITFSSNTYIEAYKKTFNTSSVETGLILMGAMNLEKITGALESEVFINITVDGIQVLEESIRSINKDSIGSTGFDPANFTVANGEHNITIYFKRTGNGAITISNFDLMLGQLETPSGTVDGFISEINYNHESNGYIPSFNVSHVKGQNSSYYTAYTLHVNASDVTTGKWYMQELLHDHIFPMSARYLSAEGIVGAVFNSFVDEHFTNLLNLSLFSITTDNPISVEGKLIEFDLMDDSEAIINSFQLSDELTNLTNNRTLTSGIYNISKKVTNFNGTSYYITTSYSIQSLTTDNIVKIYMNATELSEENCYSEKYRTFTSTVGVGNVFYYAMCNDLTIGENYTFNFFIEVPIGESINLIDESISGFEVTALDIVSQNVPPLPNDITNPLNGTGFTTGNLITWLEFQDIDGDTVTYNITLLNSDRSFNQTLNDSTILNYTIFNASNLIESQWYIINVTGCDGVTGCASSITEFYLNDIFDYTYSIKNCSNSSVIQYFLIQSIDGIETILENNEYSCEYGCNNGYCIDIKDNVSYQKTVILSLIIIILTLLVFYKKSKLEFIKNITFFLVIFLLLIIVSTLLTIPSLTINNVIQTIAIMSNEIYLTITILVTAFVLSIVVLIILNMRRNKLNEEYGLTEDD